MYFQLYTFRKVGDFPTNVYYLYPTHRLENQRVEVSSTICTPR